MAATYIETRRGSERIGIEVPARWYERLIEGFWFSICLALFMVLGPFSAPIVLGFMFSNGLFDSEMQEPESLDL